MPFLNTVLKWKCGGHQEGLDVIIINPRVILGPVLDHKDWEQGSGNY
jgi:hypothetical protein